MEYNPGFFTPKNIDDAKDIILGHHSVELESRWENETAFTITHLKNILSSTAEIKFMDFGCGIGRLSKALIQNFNASVVGVDIDSGMLDHANAYVDSDKFEAVLRKDLRALPAKVDVIVAAWTLQHCPDLEKEVLFLKNSLVDGGILYLIDQFQRVVPVQETAQGNRWLNDGKSVHYALATQLLPLRTEALPQQVCSPELHQTSAIRIYQNVEISSDNHKEVFENILARHPTPEDALVGHGLGEKLLRNGELQKGLQFMELGRNIYNSGWPLYGDPLAFPDKPIWQGEPAMGKHLLLVMEGGIGDNLLHARFIKNLSEKFAKVTVAVPPELVNIFSDLDGVSEVTTKGAPAKNVDFWLPSYSAALALGMEYHCLPKDPYIFASQGNRDKFASLTETQGLPKIGMRWRGRPSFDKNKRPLQVPRDFPTAPFFNLTQKTSAKFFSLQTGEDAKDIEGHPHLRDLSDQLSTWEDTIGLIDNLDLVISSCTATAHLAAAMGKPTWILIPAYPYYIWSEPGEKSSWYPSVTLFRQEAPSSQPLTLHPGSTVVESWDSVFQHLEERLKVFHLP